MVIGRNTFFIHETSFSRKKFLNGFFWPAWVIVIESVLPPLGSIPISMVHIAVYTNIYLRRKDLDYKLY